MDSLWAQSPSAMGMGQFPICKLKWNFLRTSVTACTIDENIFSAPFASLLSENGNLKRNFSKKVLYNPLMGCSLFSNSHLQMGVTVIGFAEHFGPYESSSLLFQQSAGVRAYSSLGYQTYAQVPTSNEE